MKPFLLAAAALAAAITAAPHAFAQTSPPDAHASHAHEPAGLQLDDGRKWPTDAAVRHGMREIGRAIAERRDAIRHERLDPAEYRYIGAVIESQVAGIVANCTLPPAADANLHVIIAQLVSAADALQGKPGSDTPAEGARRALLATYQYGYYFADPGWKSLS